MLAIPLWKQIVGPPRHATGWLAVALALGVFLFFGLLKLVVATGYRGGNTFWSNPPLAVLAILLFASGITGAIVAAFSIARHGERSLLVWAALAWGSLVLIFLVGELGGG